MFACGLLKKDTIDLSGSTKHQQKHKIVSLCSFWLVCSTVSIFLLLFTVATKHNMVLCTGTSMYIIQTHIILNEFISIKQRRKVPKQ